MLDHQDLSLFNWTVEMVPDADWLIIYFAFRCNNTLSFISELKDSDLMKMCTSYNKISAKTLKQLEFDS